MECASHGAMTIARIATFAFAGIEAQAVEVQVQIAPGLPAFLVVGLPDKAVAESRERVRAALLGLGLSLPPKRVLVNLAPADITKEGSHFDLPIALAVLAAMDVLPRDDLAGFAALGELSLDGAIMPVAGVLPAALGASARELGLICPAAQGGEAAWAGQIEVLAAPDLPALLNHFKGVQLLRAPEAPKLDAAPPSGPCLSDVKGQETVKRAMEIAAAGGHNLLMIGPPGGGKSMLAARLPAFREPHHSASMPALVGGGSRAKPGEISLAHRGVLFLDEWPEFPRTALEALRQPMETGRTTISRVHSHVTYPARFQCIAAMNPCRCGYLGQPGRECGRAPRCGEDYQMRLSGPLLDRLDLTIEVMPIAPAELARAPAGETSAAVAARVQAARSTQRARYGADGPPNNAEASLALLQQGLETEAATLLEMAATKLGLSSRGQVRSLRVARSIADLAGCATIRRAHIAEALAFRHRMPGRVAA